MTVAEEAIVPDAVKPVRQHMNEEAADELATIQSHRLLAVAVAVILPAEPDLAVMHGQQPVVRDGDTVGGSVRHSRGPGLARRKAASRGPPTRCSKLAPDAGGTRPVHEGGGTRRRIAAHWRRRPFPDSAGTSLETSARAQ